MTDLDDLIARLRDRAKSERAIQANNQAVATALRGQRLLFEQGARSEAISYAMRLCLEHENCAKHDAALAADWTEAAAALEALRDEVARLRADHGEGPAEIDEETLAAMMRNARKCAEAQDRAAREWEAMNRPPLTDQ